MTASTFVRIALVLTSATLVASCGAEAPPEVTAPVATTVEPRPGIYADFTLTADLSGLSDNQREMIRVLIEASEVMDDLYWRQAYGDDYEEWLASIGIDEARRFAELNYGPWDRLADDAPFIDGVGAKVGNVCLVPRLPSLYLAVETSAHRFAKTVGGSQVARILPPSSPLGHSPLRRVVENLQYFETVAMLNLGSAVVGCIGGESIGRGLHVPPQNPISRPIHAA